SFPFAPRARSWLALLLALAAGGQGSCGPSDKAPIRLGINPWPTWEFFYLAKEKGFFHAAGVEVRIVEFSSLGDAQRAVQRGEPKRACGRGRVGAALGPLGGVATTRARDGREPSVVLVTDYSDGADQIVAREPMLFPADLIGRRVAVEFGSLNVFVLARALE